MGQPVAGSFLFSSPPFGLFARGTKIDDVAHVKLGGNQMLLQRATLARFGLELLPRTLALEHGNSESSMYLRLPRGVWLYPLRWTRHGCLRKRIAWTAFRIRACYRSTIQPQYLGRCFK